MTRPHIALSDPEGLVKAAGMLIMAAKISGAIAGSFFSLAFVLPRSKREAFLRFCVGFVAGLIFGGTVGVKVAEWVGPPESIDAIEIALVGATIASFAAWWSLGAAQRSIEQWKETKRDPAGDTAADPARTQRKTEQPIDT